MFNKIEEWVDSLPLSQLPENTKAFNFNLYEDGDNWWSIELVATDRFDVLDQDWACDEIADFGTRDNPFSWEEEADWNDIQEEMNNALKQYLEEGKFADLIVLDEELNLKAIFIGGKPYNGGETDGT